MSQKPSERIWEIHENLCAKKGIHPGSMEAIPYNTQAILDYLDEQFEKEQQKFGSGGVGDIFDALKAKEVKE